MNRSARRPVASCACMVLLVAGRAMADPAACHVTAPVDWQGITVRWEGACANGLAEGSGVLRGLEKGQAVRMFFGRMLAGQPQIGVVEWPTGYVAGRFEAGRVVTSDDRNDTLLAFRAASQAAEAVSERFRAAGNAPSARFYRDKARRLDAQMD